MSQEVLNEPVDVDREFGEVAVFNNLVDAEDLADCLSIAEEMAKLGFRQFVGKILIQKHLLDRVSVAAILKALAARHGHAIDVDTRLNLIKLSPAEHKVLLQRARESGQLTVEQIDACYHIQFVLADRGIDTQLGEVILEKGLLSRELIDDILSGHQARKESLVQEVVSEEEAARADAVEPEPEPEAVKVLFGALAVEKKALTAEQLEAGLFAQQKMKQLGVQRRLGEILVAKKFLKKHQVQRLLSLQRERYGQISRTAVKRTEVGWHSPRDEHLARTLLQHDLLSEGELEEIRMIQKELLDLGMTESCGDIAVEHGYLERDIVDGIHSHYDRVTAKRKERAAPAGPIQVGTFKMKSDALAQCYQDVLTDIGVEDEEDDEARPEGLVRRTERGAIRADRIRSEREMAELPPSPIPRGAALIVLGFAIVSVVGYFISRALAPGPEPVDRATATERKREESESTGAGQTIEFVGIIPGGGFVSDAAPFGCVLVDQHRLAIWVEDEEGRFEEAFKDYKTRVAEEDRVCLKATGIVTDVPSGLELPPRASRKIYVRLTALEEVGIEEWRTDSDPVRVDPPNQGGNE